MIKAVLFLTIFIISIFPGCSIIKDAENTAESMIANFKDNDNNFMDNLYKLSPEEYGDMVSRKLIECFENKDKNGIKALFSEKARSECADFDKALDLALEEYNEKSIGIDNDDITESEESDYGTKTIQIAQTTFAYTEDNVYEFYFLAYPVDDSDDSNVGIWSLCVSNEKYIGNKSYKKILRDMERNPGVYSLL